MKVFRVVRVPQIQSSILPLELTFLTRGCDDIVLTRGLIRPR